MSESTPDVATQPGDELLLELADDYLRRCRAGEQPTVDEYASKHPELEDRIRELFPAMIAMEQSGPGATVDLAPPTERVGATVGRYKLLERIGEGGFGVVYMAEQQQPVRRKVAIKVIKPGIDTRQVIARFEAERQALALMEHENIARVLDGGATDTGRPYFVMELVRGVPITDFCDANQLPPRERLELFVQVCRAVQHAHTKGIIHRDIKPTNVLVTLQEGRPVPKVIDFGVAKATGQQLTDKTLFTQFAQMVGTPLYMSPEQAEMTSIDVDTRSDVYSLGVLLYELLTGTTPLDHERLKQAAFDEVRRIIREEEPPKPSTRISTMGEQAQRTISAQRKSDPAQLGRLVRGELDWIVMKALEKDRRQRYETANGLATDVERYLRDEAVEACPPSRTYRLKKFARRNRTSIAVAAASLALLLTAVVSLAVSNVLIGRERDRKQIALDNEERAVAQARRSAEEAALHLKQSLANERSMRDALYASRIIFAQQAHEAADVPRMLELLNGLRPEPGQQDLRGFEWYHLWQLCHSERLVMEDFAAPARALAYTPDGNTLITADGADVKLWNPATGQRRHRFTAAAGEIWSIALSQDGELLAVGAGSKSKPGELSVWDLRTRQRRLHVRDLPEPVMCVALSADGKRLALGTAAAVTEGVAGENSHGLPVAEGSKKNRIRLFDVESAREVADFAPSAESTSSILAIAFSPNGAFLATGSYAGDLIVWNVSTGSRRASEQHPGPVLAVAFSPDGALLVNGYGTWEQESPIVVREFPSMEQRSLLRAHTAGLTSIAFSRSGQTFATGSYDRTIGVWETATGKKINHYRGHHNFVASVTFAPDGRTVASGGWDCTARVWDAGNGYNDLRAVRPGGLGLALHSDGRAIVASQHVTVIDRAAATTRRLADMPADADANAAASPDGRWLGALHASTGELMIWDARTLERRHHFDLPPRQRPLEPHWTGNSWGLSFSADGTLVASGHADRVIIRDTVSGRIVNELKPQGAAVKCVKFAPTGFTLATSTTIDRSSIQIWDARGSEALATIEQGGMSLAFSPDASLLASGREAKIRLYDTRTFSLVRTITGHSGELWGLTFSPDGRTLASGSWDKTVRLWSVRSGELLLTYPLSRTVWDVAFSPDGRTLAASTSPGTYFFDAAGQQDADEHITAVRHRAEVLKRLGKLPEAEARLRTTLERYSQRLGPEHVWTAIASVELASVLVQRRDASRYADAEQLLERARPLLSSKLPPGHAWRWRRLYVARELYSPQVMNQPEKFAEVNRGFGAAPSDVPTATAARAATRPTEGDPNHPRASALNTQAWGLATDHDPAKRDPRGAVTLAEQSVELAPSNADFWNTLGAARYRAGDFEGAIAALQKYREFRSDDAEWSNPFLLAMAHWRLGNKEGARQWFDKGAQWMDAHNANSETMVRFRKEAAELLGVNEKKESKPSSTSTQ